MEVYTQVRLIRATPLQKHHQQSRKRSQQLRLPHQTRFEASPKVKFCVVSSKEGAASSARTVHSSTRLPELWQFPTFLPESRQRKLNLIFGFDQMTV